MIDEKIVSYQLTSLGRQVADMEYKLGYLEDEVAKLNAYINDIKDNSEEINDGPI